MNTRVIPALRSQSVQRHGRFPIDLWLLASCLLLVSLGLIMVMSASVSIAERGKFLRGSSVCAYLARAPFVDRCAIAPQLSPVNVRRRELISHNPPGEHPPLYNSVGRRSLDRIGLLATDKE